MNERSFPEQYLDMLCHKLPVVKRIITEYGECSLLQYLQHFAPRFEPSYQPIDDFLQVVHDYTERLLGKTLAQQVIQDIASFPLLLTANHLGVDSYSQFIQANILIALRVLSGPWQATTVPVFSCGHIPVNNAAYPRGILLYQTTPEELDSLPLKLPIFPNKYRSWMVSVLPAFKERMITRANAALSNLPLSSVRAKNALHTILSEDYLNDSVKNLALYSHQCTVLNGRLWKRVFRTSSEVPELVYLEHEKIIAELLQRDLMNHDSLVWNMLFTPELCHQVLVELDGIPGCWQRAILAHRLQLSSQKIPVNTLEMPLKKELEVSGTMFFWGIDHRGRRVPLSLEETQNYQTKVLRGVNDHGKIFEVPFTEKALIHGLRTHKLIPSGFMCFLPLAFARGIICVGGYFQCEYLPAMQRGLVKVLRNIPGFQQIADLLEKVPTDTYLFGMLGVMTMIDDTYLVPAGPIEMIAGGGITGADIEKILSLSVRDAHLAALNDSLLNDVPPQFCRPGWKTQIAKESVGVLGERVVIK